MYKEDFNAIIVTDIHFRDGLNVKKQSLILVNACFNICTEKKVDYILILGDIANVGNKFGKIFIDLLINKLKSIHKDINNKIFLIPGNHDLTRPLSFSGVAKINGKNKNIRDIFYTPASTETNLVRRKTEDIYSDINAFSPKDITKIGKIYFKNYVAAFNALKQKETNPFFGFDFFEKQKLGILRLNTCWTSIDSNTDNGNIIINSEIITELENQILNKLGDFSLKDVTIITLLHHPPSWWYYEELNSLDGSNTTYDFLLKYTDVLLCGHTHGTFTGHSIVYYQPTNKSDNLRKTLFIELPATLLQSRHKYYPSCITLLNFFDSHKKIFRENYIYDTDSETFEMKVSTLIEFNDDTNTDLARKEKTLENLNLEKCSTQALNVIFNNPIKKLNFTIQTLKSNFKCIDPINKINDTIYECRDHVYAILFDVEEKGVPNQIENTINDYILSSYYKVNKINIIYLYPDRRKRASIEKKTYYDYEDYIYNVFLIEIKKRKEFFIDKYIFLNSHNIKTEECILS